MRTETGQGGTSRGRIVCVGVLLGMLVTGIGAATTARAQEREADAAPRRARPMLDRTGRRLLEQGIMFLETRQYDRGEQMLESVIRDYPDSLLRHMAHMALAEHFRERQRPEDALAHLRQVTRFLEPRQGREVDGEGLALYVESLFRTGVVYYETGRYGEAFPFFRRITAEYPQSPWSNKAYYHIGMAHYRMRNWSRAVDALQLVGTFSDPDAPAAAYVEAGHRFYVKIHDADFPILTRLGEEVTVEVWTDGGDRETIRCIPLVGDPETYIGSIPTTTGVARPGNDTLEVRGGDTIHVRYVDANTRDGARNVPREAGVRVVSTATLGLYRGDLETWSTGAHLGQEQHILLRDADLDISDAADTATVTVRTRYMAERDPEAMEEGDGGGDTYGDGLEAFMEADAEWVVRDEITVTLLEQGEAPVRTGRFAGTVLLVPDTDAAAARSHPHRLLAAEGDELQVVYIDERHIGGEVPRQVVATLPVAGEIESQPRATQYVVFDPVLRAEKNLVEGRAFLELARIFLDMGLRGGARRRADEGLGLVDEVIRSDAPIPRHLREEAFELKWELEIAKEAYDAATATCRTFARMYPDSVRVDAALMRIGRILAEAGEYREAVATYEQVLALENPLSAPEARFWIAEVSARQDAEAAHARGEADAPLSARALMQYTQVFERYPESHVAGKALEKVIGFYIDTGDYPRANELLARVFAEYPDADFLDRMLLRWAVVSFRMGDLAGARSRCRRLLTEYPGSPLTQQARTMLSRMETQE